MYQIINGLNYWHSRRIIHRDIKPQNLLIDEKGKIKISDLDQLQLLIETLWYRAPQVLLGQKQYSLGVDTWAIECIFAELTEKKPLFNGDSQIDQIFKIYQFHGTLTLKYWPNISELPEFKHTFPKLKKVNPQIYFKNFDNTDLDLFLKLINIDRAQRISMKQAFKSSILL